jgi:hypothetical protein
MSQIPQEVLEDFRNHMYVCFKYMGYSSPTQLQYAMADAFQSCPGDQQLQAGRGAGKSVIAAVVASWWLARDPNCTILVISASSAKATEFVSMVRNILTVVPYMKHLAPTKEDKDNAFGFNVAGKTVMSQDTSISARGITSQIVGKHADYLIFDDVEVITNSETEVQREKLFRKVLEAEPIRNKGGKILFLGTPQTEDSIYNKLAHAYPVIKFPAVMPDKGSAIECHNVAPWVLDLPLDPGAPTQPERFDQTFLDRALSTLGPKLFTLNYKLQTALADLEKYPLKLKDLVVLDLDRELLPMTVIWQSYPPKRGVPSYGMVGDYLTEVMNVGEEFRKSERTCLFIDPSGRGEDETGICVASTLAGRIFIHELIGSSDGYGEKTLDMIQKLIVQYRISEIVYESNYGDGMFGKILHNHLNRSSFGASIVEKKVSGMKEKRIIDTLEPVFASHKLVFDTKAIRDELTQRQITRICAERGALKHDDRVDVLALAVDHLKTGVMLDSGTILKRDAEKEQAAWMADYLKKARTQGALLEKIKSNNIFTSNQDLSDNNLIRNSMMFRRRV